MAFFLYLYTLKQYTMLTIFILVIILVIIWLSYEIWAAPTYDEETMKIIKPEKKFKDLFKKKL